VEPRPFEVDYSKRLFDCGTAESTYEVKNKLLKTFCETRKTIAAEPQLTVPQVKYMLKDPLAPGTQTNPSNTQTQIAAERPNIMLSTNRPYTSGCSNKNAIKEQPIIMNNVYLERNNPLSSQFTNKSGPIFNVEFTDISFDRLAPKPQLGCYEARPLIPPTSTDVVLPTLLRVR
jgi:hypothetical protein